jgi:phosphohistidine phosphatase
MRRLMLLRHAKSDWPDGVDDHERPLGKRGRRTSPMMGAYMAKEDLLPDCAIVSTARRARETWELVRAMLAQNIIQKDEPRLYDASAYTILAVVKKASPDVHVLLLVGHNPGFHELALKLIGKERQSDLSRLQRKFPTAGLAVIDFNVGNWSDVSEGLGRLERFETPKSIGGLTM